MTTVYDSLPHPEVLPAIVILGSLAVGTAWLIGKIAEKFTRSIDLEDYDEEDEDETDRFT